MSKITDLIQQALKGDSLIDAKISFGNIFNFIAQKINADTGTDRRGAEIVITAYDIAHIFKGHGNDKIEKERGQIGVNEKDIELIKDIIFNYDNVVKEEM